MLSIHLCDDLLRNVLCRWNLALDCLVVVQSWRYVAWRRRRQLPITPVKTKNFVLWNADFEREEWEIEACWKPRCSRRIFVSSFFLFLARTSCKARLNFRAKKSKPPPESSLQEATWHRDGIHHVSPKIRGSWLESVPQNGIRIERSGQIWLIANNERVETITCSQQQSPPIQPTERQPTQCHLRTIHFHRATRQKKMGYKKNLLRIGTSTVFEERCNPVVWYRSLWPLFFFVRLVPLTLEHLRLEFQQSTFAVSAMCRGNRPGHGVFAEIQKGAGADDCCGSGRNHGRHGVCLFGRMCPLEG